MRVRGLTLVFLAIALILGGVVMVNAGNESIVTANIYPSGSSGGGSVVSFWVPDTIDVGNVTVGKAGAEFKVYVNNTGSTNIRVTPKLANQSDMIMKKLYLRPQKTSSSNASLTAFVPIGNYTFEISKPTSSQNYSNDYFYLSLNLTDYNGNVTNPLINHQAKIVFEVVSY